MEVVDVVTVSSREFNQDVGAAKRAAQSEPVVITDRGEPAFVLLSIDEYRRITGAPRTLYEALRMKPGFERDFDWDIEAELGPREIEELGDPFADWDS